ncbi:MAG: hypothetical protein JWQ27_2159 [Ferruginibacter sp.]|nr:hypothetical protein [Ferruginibacter sp.]
MRKGLFILIAVIILLLIFANIPEGKKQLATEHFIFSYSQTVDSTGVRELAADLENNYARISHDLFTKPAPHIQVNIYGSRWRYIKATGHWMASGNIEGSATLHFVNQAWSEADNKKVALHEFSHAVVLQALINQADSPLNRNTFDLRFARFPTWLWESLSLYEAGQFRDPKTLAYIGNGKYPDLNELNSRTKGGKIYDVGYTIVEYILKKYGRGKLLELMLSYGDLQQTLQLSDSEFSKNWYDFVNEKYLHN